jgi:Bacterial protein of unknown function (DUF899)/Pyridoxamine 5'-phosphate oxidase
VPNLNLGFSSSVEQTRGWAAPMFWQLPPIAARNATDTGARRRRLPDREFGLSVFVLGSGAVYQTYSVGARGVEFLMGLGIVVGMSSDIREACNDRFQHEARALLAGPNIAHIATLMPDGGPHSVPVMIDVEGEYWRSSARPPRARVAISPRTTGSRSP